MLQFSSLFPILSSRSVTVGICKSKAELTILIRLSKVACIKVGAGSLGIWEIYLELSYGVHGWPGSTLPPTQGLGTYQHINSTAHPVFLALIMHDDGSVVQEIL